MSNLQATPSGTMRALVVEHAQAPFKIQRIEVPRPRAGQVLVRVHAAGVNPLDTKIHAGKAAHARQPLPAVLGMDLAGTVEALGDGVADLNVGDAVYGLAGGIGGRQGTLAEFVAVDAALVAVKPASLGMREAAAMPLAFITAWEGLVDRANVHRGQRVLVHGGAGGVGHMAVQLARARGAAVFATVDASQMDLARELGATPIDYRSTSVAQYVDAHTGGEGFDIVYDTVGGQTLDASFEAVRRYTGHVLTSLGWGTHSLAPLSFKGATYSGVFTLLPMLTGEGLAHHGQILREAARLVEAGQLRPLVDNRRFSLETAGAAFDVVAGGTSRGKVVVDVDR